MERKSEQCHTRSMTAEQLKQGVTCMLQLLSSLTISMRPQEAEFQWLQFPEGFM